MYIIYIIYIIYILYILYIYIIYYIHIIYNIICISYIKLYNIYTVYINIKSSTWNATSIIWHRRNCCQSDFDFVKHHPLRNLNPAPPAWKHQTLILKMRHIGSPPMCLFPIINRTQVYQIELFLMEGFPKKIEKCCQDATSMMFSPSFPGLGIAI